MRSAAVLHVAVMLLWATTVAAQGITTASVRGTLRISDGSDPDGARVTVRSSATGFVSEVEVRRGRFLVSGLEPGGPYSITVRRIGARARRWDEVYLRLGEPFDLEATLDPAPIVLDSLVAQAASNPNPSREDGGTGMILPDSLIHALPSLNGNVYDFLRLVPQISTRVGFPAGGNPQGGLGSSGISGGGAGFRANQFLTNGVSERSLAGAQVPEFAGGKSLPFEAVKEYEALVAPFDVRYGDFTGAMVNAVTRAGTNAFAGSAFVRGRSDALGRSGELASGPYDRWQLGLSVGGPIVRDRVQIFMAGEFQDQTSPMSGPYVGQPANATPPLPVDPADIERMESILGQYGLVAGSGAAVQNEGKLRNIFARIDASLPSLQSRAVLWFNSGSTRAGSFVRSSADTFQLTSFATEQISNPRTIAFQLHTSLGSGQNEFSLSHRVLPFGSEPVVHQPIVMVRVPATTGGSIRLMSGTPSQAQGPNSEPWNLILRDVITFPAGASHAISVGIESEWFHVDGGVPGNTYGTWDFQSLDSLSSGLAARYELGRDFGSAGIPFTGTQLATYLSDQWRPSDRLTITVGIRADLLVVNGNAPYNASVDSLFGRRTDEGLDQTLAISPRLGFTWDLEKTGRDRLRGGAGIFAGRPPLSWFHMPIQNYGTGTGTLRCGTTSTDLGLPPLFDPDPFDPPVACRGGVGLETPPTGDVELTAPNIGLGRSLRAVLAYERRLPWNLTGTIEALLTKNLSDYMFTNLNLAGPQPADRFGRVPYGTIDAAGRATPARVTTAYPSVIELVNVSPNHAAQLAVSLQRPFASGSSLMASYTWTRVRDVQTPPRVNNRGITNWSSRAVSGLHEDLDPGISLNDVPHRLTFAGTWRAPWRTWRTELSFIYVGESGSPFTWLVGGQGRGDLNADGAVNDPIYVPSSALDEDQIVFTGISDLPGADNSPAAQAERIAAQREGFERFITESPCLSAQRAAIMARNSCREPWASTTALSLRQFLPITGHPLEMQLDVYNVLNLLNSSWGHRQVRDPTQVLLSHVRQGPGPTGESEPVFRFSEAATQWTTVRSESVFQLQFGVRYRF